MHVEKLHSLLVGNSKLINDIGLSAIPGKSEEPTRWLLAEMIREKKQPVC